MKPPQTFFQKYIVTIVMIPSIIGIHIGWSLLQKNSALVKEEEQMELPIITSTKYLWNRLQNYGNSSSEDKAK